MSSSTASAAGSTKAPCESVSDRYRPGRAPRFRILDRPNCCGSHEDGEFFELAQRAIPVNCRIGRQIDERAVRICL